MPLAESTGEILLKATSVRQFPLDGGHVRIEVDFSGEAKGAVPGHHLGTLISFPLDPALPYAWSYLGTTLAHSGSIIRITGEGSAIRTGEGHKIRFRGAVRYQTTDPKLAEFNHMIGAVETEADPMTMTLKGAGCVWK